MYIVISVSGVFSKLFGTLSQNLYTSSDCPKGSGFIDQIANMGISKFQWHLQGIHSKFVC